MCLPQQINELITAVAAAQPKTVVALCNGAPVEMPWVNEVNALLELYLGGQVRDWRYGPSLRKRDGCMTR